MRNKYLSIVLIVLLVAFTATTVFPNSINSLSKSKGINLGLDLQGGIQLTYQIDTSKLGDKSPDQAQQETVDLITRRVNENPSLGTNLGVSEANVQGTKFDGNYGVLVELPGVHDIQQAKDIIGKTAQLKFYEMVDNKEQETNLTGSDVVSAQAGTDKQQTGFSSVSPVIYLDFTADGGKKFADITKRNIGKPIITKLDDQVINQATVQAEIDSGKAQITGIATLKEAKDTAQAISEGALPAPINPVHDYEIGAALGKDAVEKSLIAGLIGLILVAIFMIAYYRTLGVVAVVGLLIYSVIVMAVFKMISATLTLSGIAGFIFSIGVAVDANILVFERFKEEKRKDIPTTQALENGFVRSWPSIRDSNTASFLTAFVLYEFGSGTVKGFAVTLMIGIFVSIFTSIYVTRNILRLFVTSKQTA